MRLTTKRSPALWLSAGLVGALLCGVSTQALAAAAPGSDAKLQAMQRQLDEMRVQAEKMRTGSAQQDPRLTAIQQQLEAMAAQLAEMKTTQESASTDIATLKQAPSGSFVTPTLSSGKPAFASTDGRFTANIKAIMMFDTGKYFQKNNLPAAVTNRDLNEGSNFRRARIGLDGKLFRDFDYSFIYEFGGSGGEDPGRLYEASMTYTAIKPLRIKVGAFEPNIGLAAATSTGQMAILERPAPAEVARNVAAGDSRVGFQVSGNGVFGEGDSGLATRWFATTAFTGNTISSISSAGSATTQPFDEQTAWIGRIALAPYSTTDWQAHVGGNLQYVIQPNDSGAAAPSRYGVQLRDRPELRVDGTRLIDTGLIDARHVTVMGLEAAFQTGPFLIESEYFRYKVDRRITTVVVPTDPRFSGWYVQGSWILTNETRAYNPVEARFDGPKPTYNFNPEAGTWGAFEVAARYSMIDLNYREGAGGLPVLGAVRGGEQGIGTLGVNWYLNPSMRIMLDYQRVKIDRLGPTGLHIGQTYNALAARGQVNF